MKLEMWLFGDFGYAPLIERYQQLHDDVTIQVRVADHSPSYHRMLVDAIDEARPPDIAAIEVSHLPAHLARPQDFHNLLELGAKELESSYLDWKWRQGLTPDGASLIGLGTDIGPMTMCYRRDLLSDAGLPSDRSELAQMWGTWDGFMSFGQQYTNATGRRFVHSGEAIFDAVINQAPERYYDGDGALIVESSERVRLAWDLAAKAVASAVAMEICAWTPEWSAALSDGAFAAVPCPAWMRPYIERNAPRTAGRWDMTAMPEVGANWGGSFLALPARSDKAEEAYRLISWLLAPAQQLDVFKRTGNFPSSPELFNTEEIMGFADDFFGDAPVGRLYAESALDNIEPLAGPADAVISARFHNALKRVASGTQVPDDGWDSACEAVRASLASTARR